MSPARAANLVLVLCLAAVSPALAQDRPAFFDTADSAAFARSQAGHPALVHLRSRAFLMESRRSEPLVVAGVRTALVRLSDAAGNGTAADLAAAGLQLLQPTGRRVVIARVAQPEDWASVANAPQVAALERLYPEDRLAEALWRASPPAYSVREDGTWQVTVMVGAPADLASVQEAVVELGGYVVDPSPLPDRFLEAAIPQDAALTLAGRDDVLWVEPAAHIPVAENANAQAADEVDTIQAAPYSLDGTGVRVGVWDQGRCGSHDDLLGRQTNVDSSSVASHSTHVTGTIAGNGNGAANAEGMAPNAQVYNYDWNGNVFQEMADAANGFNIVASSNSWGFVVGWYYSGGWTDYGNGYLFGSYSSQASALDSMVRTSGISVMWSAGNDRDDGPSAVDHDGTLQPDGEYYDVIGPFGCAKSCITVGSVADDGTTLAGYSSFGTTDDGRVKPDLVANGQSLRSTVPNNQYSYYSGTSMSTPVVTGLLADLVQLYRSHAGGQDPSPDLLKAILCHTAVDLHHPGPDARTGFGRASGRRAADAIGRHFDPVVDALRSDTVSSGQVRSYAMVVPPGQGRLAVTLVWIDVAGSPGAATALINDLDLRLVGPGGSPVALPYRLSAANPHLAATQGVNTADTIEQVVLDDPPAGVWTLEVEGTSVTGGAQEFALISENDLGGQAGVRTISGRITDCGLPLAGVEVRLTGHFAQDGITDSSGRFVFQVSDGSYTLTPQAAGLTLNPSSRSVTVAGSDVSGQDFEVTQPGNSPGITTGSLPSGREGMAYSQILGVSGGSAPYTWSVVDGALPVGLTLAVGSGLVAGTPTVCASYDFTVQVEDSAGRCDAQAYTVIVEPPPARVDLLSVQVGFATVTQGQLGIPVTVQATNPTTRTASVSSAGLTFVGQADRTSEYTVTAVPGNPTSVSAGAVVSFAFTVDVSLAATVEPIVVDGTISGTDAGTGTPFTDPGADTPGQWLVVTPAQLRIDSTTVPQGSVVAGTTGLAVSAHVTNLGGTSATITQASLQFQGAANRTSEYTVTPDPGNPTTIAPGGGEDFLFTVDVSPAATQENVVVDAAFDGTDAVTGASLATAGAVAPSSWTVLSPAVPALPLVDASSDSVMEGDTGELITVIARNDGQGDLVVSTAALTFSLGGTDVSAEYTVTPDPGNPGLIAPGASVPMLFTVDVNMGVTAGVVTLDAELSGTDATTGLPVSVVGAVQADTWTVALLSSQICGDCDNSGSVSILDSLLAAQSDAGIATVEPLAMGQCNVAGTPGNGPGTVTVIDALLIAQYVVGLNTLSCVP